MNCSHRVAVAAIATFLFVSLWSSDSWADCLKVAPSEKIVIDPNALKNLSAINLDRNALFEAVKNVAVPETSGCWAGATGNFDGQLISLGVMQWNYGQGSLQPKLRAFQTQMGALFPDWVTRSMPQYGKLIFSNGCLRQQITTDCQNAILAMQPGDKLNASAQAELNALFESTTMIQIQMDGFVALVESVKDDLLRMFGKAGVSPLRIKWAIDTKVQQGTFPGNADIVRVRNDWTKLSPEQRGQKLHRLIQWYEGLSNSIDQDGVKADWNWNVQVWNQKIATGLKDEQEDLLNLTFLRSRTAVGESGRWQALTFERRAKIIFGVGSLYGERFGS